MAMRATLGKQPAFPLQSGDVLSREEFERRYDASPDLKKAELIEGVVYVGSPVPVDHSRPQMRLAAWLATYESRHPGVEAHDNVTVVLPDGSLPQPDLLLRRQDGTSTISGKGYVEGPPELVIEIAVSSASIDLHAKKAMYERAGVPEYLVWRTLDNEVDWFALDAGRYAPLSAGGGGRIESRQFPGLSLSVETLLDGSLADLLALIG